MKNRKGFTLIELLLSLSLFLIILSLIFSIYAFGTSSYHKQNEEVKHTTNLRIAMGYLTREIRKSEYVNVSDNILTLDSGVYKLKDNLIVKDGKTIMSGIDGLIITQTDSKVEIKIIINKKKTGKYERSSTIYIR